jgi:crotonobetainyl-CoA:carnitine CoA-transferase CaiB-like acyl-CoA transferase
MNESAEPERPAPGPLAGLLVADFTRVLAGPYATMMLADLGADVVKVESPAGDDTRHWRPPERDGIGTYYLGINRNKRSLRLDFNSPRDLACAHELAHTAAIVVHNFRIGSLTRFGLDYQSVASRNPRVVYCSISGFGSGPGAGLPGYDLLVQGASGLMSLTGEPDGPAYRTGLPVFDVMTGMNAVVGILAALRHLERTGRGQHVEVNLLSTALSALANQASAYVAGGVVPRRVGNAHPTLFPYEPLPTRGGELLIVAGNDAQFSRLAEALGRPELCDDDRYGTSSARSRNRSALRVELVQALKQHDAADWFAILTAAGVPCGPVSDVREGFDLATRLELEPVVEVGGVPTVANPIRLSLTPVQYRLPPPQLGEHDEEILAELADKPQLTE